MGIKLSVRTIVRIASFFVAVTAVLSVLAFRSASKAQDYKLKLEYSYMRAIEELSSSTDNITNTLSKGIYAGTPSMLETLSAKLWREASIAKSALSQLPVSDLQLDSTNKFLSQVGNYAVSISEKAAQGEPLSLEEYSNLAALYDYSKVLSQELWGLEKKAQSGLLSFEKTAQSLNNQDTSAPPSVFEGFSSFEEGFANYPTLIYDGPFSDHILEKEPELTKNQPEADADTALQKAALSASVSPESLTRCEDENGKMPAFCFNGENLNVAITKQGGLVSYMIKSRSVEEKKLTAEDAISTAQAYLLNLEISDMTTTYYETLDNICTINFAGTQSDAVIYPDLIKVSVAMDNGEIMGMDARGYIVNHHEREAFEPEISIGEAQAKLSPLLTAEKSGLAVIPTEGENEVYAYEFLCSSRQGTKILVYVNAQTGEEEQILILLETEDGVLTV
ncbi:MAG: germination protein YpeB [Oscillospiraceae bacterium]|jgi:germination protein YpeB